MNRKQIIATVLAAVLLTSTGCQSKDGLVSYTEITDSVSSDANESSKIMSEFNALMLLDPSEREVIDFLDKYLPAVDEYYADKMILSLEKIQSNSLDIRQLNFYKGEIQDMFTAEFGETYYKMLDTDEKLNSIGNQDLKDYIKSYLDIGYMIVRRDGGYYPQINYGYYSKYKAFASDEIDYYIDIMTLESASPPVISETMKITWDEVFRRILYYEKYLNAYKGSNRYDAVFDIYSRYIYLYLMGTEKTPAFSEDGTIRKYLKQSYDNVYLDNSDSQIVVSLRDYFKILEETNYRYTSNVSKSRTKIFENMGLHLVGN